MPSTRCSSRATTCWMRSTHTWRNWLLRWAERHLHSTYTPPTELCHFLRHFVYTGIALVLIWTIDKSQLHNLSVRFSCNDWNLVIQCTTFIYMHELLCAPSQQVCENCINASLPNVDLICQWKLSLCLQVKSVTMSYSAAFTTLYISKQYHR